jgi:pimeloyl-ACP methyl ester carboxylesterase
VQNDLDAPLSTPADARVRAERPGYVEFSERKLLACSPAMYAAMAIILTSAEDRLDRLREVGVATLVVVGDEDEPFLADSERMAEAMPDARLVVIPDAGHSPQFVSGFLSEYVPTSEQPVPTSG